MCLNPSKCSVLSVARPKKHWPTFHRQHTLVFALARPWNGRPTLIKLRIKQIPLWEYSSAVWDLFKQKDIDKLEKSKNKRSAAICVTQNYRQTASVTSLIQDLGWTDLKTRRHLFLCMFKILNEIVGIPINDHLIPADKRTRGGLN